LVFDLFNLDGILGDTFCANGAFKPTLSVLGRRYRLRLYNPGPSRWYEFALFDRSKFLPFYQVSTDGNLLPQAVQGSNVRLASRNGPTSLSISPRRVRSGCILSTGWSR
jgi:hypothetical protein